MASIENKDLSCSICYNVFENPRSFPCGHSFCGTPRPCVKRLISSRQNPLLECPYCKRPVQKENPTEEDFPLNEDLIEVIKKKQEDILNNPQSASFSRSQSGSSKMCQTHNAVKTHFCAKCRTAICWKDWTDGETHENHGQPLEIDDAINRYKQARTKLDETSNALNASVEFVMETTEKMAVMHQRIKNMGNKQDDVVSGLFQKELPQTIESFEEEVRVTMRDFEILKRDILQNIDLKMNETQAKFRNADRDVQKL
ncbi:tripartite motif-containing protein 59-like isoform X3 [Symsagittifera roscoffensis]|uniref:tripartite motif-containing protein 59-like isoform X3 n=1 Tax=Symsagittifera roscoffensis TaxID=84072 RepID=UPI00307BC419